MKRSFASSNGNSPLQQQIATMLGDRVRKPRPCSSTLGPSVKRQKLNSDKDAYDQSTPIPSVQPPPQAAQDTDSSVQSQKRKWRLAEIIKMDREAKCLKSLSNRPSFALICSKPDSSADIASSPDSTRAAASALTTPSASTTTTPSKKQIALVPKRVTFAPEAFESASTPHSRSSALPYLSGGEAILYERDMLPRSHGLLLDILTSMESALSLLRTRKASATVGSIREIVQKDTKRNFTLRMLSQIAHLVPECVAVLSGRAVTFRHKRPSDNLVVRLDDPNQLDEKNGQVDTIRLDDGSTVRDSVLGDSAARVRRALLHKRLLSHVKEQHNIFLQNRSCSWGESAWHPDFDLNRDVKDLPAPTLFEEKGQNIKQLSSGIPKKGAISALASNQVDPNANSCSEINGDSLVGHSETPEEGESDLPKSLLARVRSREKARSELEAKVGEERVSNRSLASKLPCTMDTVNTVLRTERRSAIGWRQLIAKVATVHPRKWSKDDIERQIDAIVTIATDWCKKVELKSSGGGYAFRVISEKSFANARAKVCATETIALE